ncbi:T9SS type A sorting domain-containing protein [Winogradskyella sp. 3972H.M.0a.05]|uniref:T9SS type A sorting domain-containing protein n=1 Tax=Winogradskyella sp. 3972H.M.0a.05 TaxID=2950277 RepID=UPI00339A8204
MLRTTLRLIQLVAVILLTTNTLSGQEYDLDTSLNLYWPVPTVEVPGYLETVVDPTFNTNVIRITGDVGTPIPNISGQNWRNVARHGYSTRQPWNSDESILMLERHQNFTGGGFDLFLDGQTYEVIKEVDLPSGNEFRWHHNDPDLMWIIRDDELVTWSYSTEQVTQIMSFSGYSDVDTGGTGNFSDDGTRVAVSATRDSDNTLVVFYLDLETQTKGPDIDISDVVNLGHISLSSKGNYIISVGTYPSGGDRTKVYTAEGTLVGFWDDYAMPTHYDLATDTNGDEVAVGVSKSEPHKGKMIKRRLSDGQITELTVGGWPPHTSARALGRPGWVYAWTASSLGYQPYLNELIAVKLDGSRVERIAHCRNVFDAYLNEAHAVPSPSGGRILFASDWANDDLPISTFVVDFRDRIIDSDEFANAGQDEEICIGDSVTLTASGGTDYVWNTGATTASITVSPTTTTTYTVTVTSSSGAEDTDDVTVTVNPLPIANAGSDETICDGESVTLTASGGTDYLWNTGATTQSIEVSPSSTTTYSVEVSTNDCSDTDEVTVTVNPSPNVSAGNNVTILYGESTTLTASGATTYQWNTGSTDESIDVSPTETTTYTVTGTTNGCSDEATVTVTVETVEVTANAGDDQEICEGESVTLTASGGTDYLWNTGATTASITVSPNQTTTYSVTVSNDNGGEDTDEVTVTVTEIPVANAGSDETICDGESITLTASGGTDYLWNTGATTQSIEVSPNSTTTYSVEVSTNDCSDTDEVIVTVNPSPNVSAGNNVTILQGESTTLTASGATTYQWNTGATDESIDVSPTETTTYTVTGTTNGCSDEATVTVTVETVEVTANAGDDQEICEGESVTLTASGGTNYLWNTGATTASITVSPNQTTTYSVTVSNSLGSEDTDEVIVFVNETPIADAGNDQEICEGETVTLTASGGTDYLWNTGATTQSIEVSPNSTTTYSVEVFSNDCSDTDEVTVTVNPLPEVSAGPDITILFGESATLTASGANEYQWNTGATGQSIDVSPTETTTYTVVGITNGCSSEATVTVFVESSVQASAGANQRVCDGYDYEVVLTASGGDTYLWSTGETTQSITVTPLSTTTYTVIVYQGNFQDEAEVTVFVDPNPSVVISNGDDVTILDGDFVTLSASGANEYEWSNGATQPNIAVNPSVTTTYEVIGYINNCYDTKEITVNVVPQVQANAGDDVMICLDESATLTASGGDEYLWSTGETTQSITVAPQQTTEYTVTVFNELDFDEATVMVEVDVNCEEEIIVENPEFEFRVYPNPTSDILNVKMTGLYNTSKLYLYDLSGKVLISSDIEDTLSGDPFTKQLNLNNLNSGIYFVRIEYDNQEIIEKVIVN